MKMTFLRRFSLMVVFLLFQMVNHSVVVAQGQGLAVVSEETYEKVIDILFTQKELDTSFEFAWVIRLSPTYAGESQIVIVKRLGNVEIVEYASLEGSIRSKLDQIFQRTSREDPVEMAKEIKIRRRLVNIPGPQFRELRNRFSTSVYTLLIPRNVDSRSKAGVDTLYLHGTKYDLTYIDNSGEITYSTLGPELGSKFLPKSSPLVAWINEVWKTIAIANNTSTKAPG